MRITPWTLLVFLNSSRLVIKMSQSEKKISRQLAELLFNDLDLDKQGVLNLENMKKIHNDLPNNFRDMVRDKLRKFVIENQRFLISKDEFLELFPKNSTPYVHIDLSNVKDVQRIKELSQSELQNVINKRMGIIPPSDFKPKFIRKGRSSSKPSVCRDSQERSKRGKDLVFIRKSYFGSLL